MSSKEHAPPKPVSVAAFNLRHVPGYPDDRKAMARFIFEHLLRMRAEPQGRSANGHSGQGRGNSANPVDGG